MTIYIALAGVPIQVCCRHPQNLAFLSAYRTEEEPVLRIEPSAEDLRKSRQALVRMAEKEGLQNTAFSDVDIENNALHALIAEQMAQRSVLLFHGSALCLDDEAVIFTAPSGTGKSTQARLWREALGARVQMINDDKPLIRLEGYPPVVYGSPWDGKHRLSRNMHAPLKAVLLVRRSEENRLEPMAPADAFQTLLQQGYLPEHAETRARMLARENAMVHSTSFYRLYCTMEPEAVQVAMKGIWQGSSR